MDLILFVLFLNINVYFLRVKWFLWLILKKLCGIFHRSNAETDPTAEAANDDKLWRSAAGRAQTAAAADPCLVYYTQRFNPKPSTPSRETRSQSEEK